MQFFIVILNTIHLKSFTSLTRQHFNFTHLFMFTLLTYHLFLLSPAEGFGTVQFEMMTECKETAIAWHYSWSDYLDFNTWLPGKDRDFVLYLHRATQPGNVTYTQPDGTETRVIEPLSLSQNDGMSDVPPPVLSLNSVCYYRSQAKLRKGNVLTPVCQSFCSQGGLPQCMLGYTHPGRHPPPADGYCCRRYASYWNAFL